MSSKTRSNQNTKRSYKDSARKTLRKNKSEADKSNSYFDKSYSIANKVFKKRLREGPQLAPMDGIKHYLKESNKALKNNNIQKLMMSVAFLSVYAGTFNAESSVDLSTLKFPGADPNYLIEYNSIKVDDTENTRKLRRYEEKLERKSTRDERINAKRKKKGKV
jgi:hypothetical protein